MEYSGEKKIKEMERKNITKRDRWRGIKEKGKKIVGIEWGKKDNITRMKLIIKSNKNLKNHKKHRKDR